MLPGLGRLTIFGSIELAQHASYPLTPPLPHNRPPPLASPFIQTPLPSTQIRFRSAAPIILNSTPPHPTSFLHFAFAARCWVCLVLVGKRRRTGLFGMFGGSTSRRLSFDRSLSSGGRSRCSLAGVRSAPTWINVDSSIVSARSFRIGRQVARSVALSFASKTSGRAVRDFR